MKRTCNEPYRGLRNLAGRGWLLIVAGLFSMMLHSTVQAQGQDRRAGGKADEFKGRVYVGAGIVGSRLDPDTDEVPESVDDRSGFGGSVTLGYDLLPRLSIESHFADLGEAGLSPDGSVDYRVGGLDVLLYGMNDEQARRLREGFSLFGRLGLGVLEVDSSLPVDEDNQYSLLTGLGVEYGLGSGVGLRAEVVSHDSDARYAQLGMIYRFGSAGMASVSRASVGRGEIAAEPSRGTDDVVSDNARNPIDKDADGVPDVRDDCPVSNKSMPVDAAGCDAFDNASSLVDFRFASDELTQVAKNRLDEVEKVMGRFKDSNIVIDAHTDNVGDALINLQLSAMRAIAVARYLIDNGIDGDRLQPRAYGESRPRASNATAEGRAANRRVEFRVQ